MEESEMLKKTVFMSLMLSFAGTAIARNPDDTLRRHGDAFREIDGRFSLHFIDAVTGKPISNATILFDGERARTDRQGMAHFEIPMDLEDGDDKRFAQFKAKGYATTKLPLDFMMGSLWFNRYSISPKLTSDKLRIVVDWNAEPADLDAHLVKENSYHISYREKRKFQDRAWLDRDDMNGHGPETVTINRMDQSASYRFFVHDYTHRKNLPPNATGISKGKAHVRVYDDSGLIHTFRAPKNKPGVIWEVFRIVEGEIKPVNKVK